MAAPALQPTRAPYPVGQLAPWAELLAGIDPAHAEVPVIAAAVAVPVPVVPAIVLITLPKPVVHASEPTKTPTKNPVTIPVTIPSKQPAPTPAVTPTPTPGAKPAAVGLPPSGSLPTPSKPSARPTTPLVTAATVSKLAASADVVLTDFWHANGAEKPLRSLLADVDGAISHTGATRRQARLSVALLTVRHRLTLALAATSVVRHPTAPAKHVSLPKPSVKKRARHPAALHQAALHQAALRQAAR